VSISARIKPARQFYVRSSGHAGCPATQRWTLEMYMFQIDMSFAVKYSLARSKRSGKHAGKRRISGIPPKDPMPRNVHNNKDEKHSKTQPSSHTPTSPWKNKNKLVFLTPLVTPRCALRPHRCHRYSFRLRTCPPSVRLCQCCSRDISLLEVSLSFYRGQRSAIGGSNPGWSLLSVAMLLLELRD